MTWVSPDALVFTGGIGEHDEKTRSEILVRINAAANSKRVLTISAREDLVMAEASRNLLGRT